MLPSSLDVATFALLFTVLMAMLIGVLWTWIWALRRLWLRVPLLDDLRPASPRPVPWGASTIALTVFLYFLVSVLVVRAYEGATGRRLPRRATEVQKPEPLREEKAIPAKGSDPGPAQAPAAVGPAGRADGQEKQADHGGLQSQGELMVQSSIINLVLLLLVPPLVMRLTGATLADFGWDTRNWPRQLFLGARAGMLVTPIVFAVQNLAIRIWPPQKHPLEEMVLQQFSPAVALLAVGSAVILAPVVEEMLFRGMLQQWLIKYLLGRGESEPLKTSESLLDSAVWDESRRPAEGPVDSSPSPTSDERDPESTAALPAILLTSALFAAMHYSQWPAPIAIFVLSIWLGTVFYRGGSLISAVALHGTFNGFSTLMLLLEALSRKLAPNVAVSMFWSLVEHLT